MNQIFQNIKSFAKQDRLIFFITLLCIFISALLLNFSYGLYQNYHALKEETELDLKRMDITVNHDANGSLLTKADLCTYLNAISPDILESIDLIYTTAKHPPLFEKSPEEGGGYESFYYRFCIRDGSYCISSITKDSWEDSGMIVSGRYITNREEANGSDVAIVSNLYASGRNEQTIKIQKSDDEIEMFGKTYQIVGEYSGGWNTPVIPFLSIPDDSQMDHLSFVFSSNITRSTFEELQLQATMLLPGVLEFPILDFPDTDTYYLYNNIMLISVLLAMLSALNFAMLYQYILQKRNKELAVFRLCGCTRAKATGIYLSECLWLSIPTYILGNILFDVLLKNVLIPFFPNMEHAFSLAVYLVIFLIYIIAVLLILGYMISGHVRRQIMEEWRG